MHRVRTLKRAALALVALVGTLVYVWVAAVRAVPGVRRQESRGPRRPPELIDPPQIRGGPATRASSLVAGLFLFAAGIVLQLESDLGLGPWDVLNQGLSERTPLSFGAANIVVALVVLVLAWSLGARIGPGTVANAVLIGVFVDLLLRLDFVERLSSQPLGARVALLAGGILLVGLGSGLYIGAALGAGPRDSLMLVGARRTGARLGIVRTVLEIAVAAVGFALGGTLGIGTLAFALGVGPAVELGFAVLARLRLTTPAGTDASTIRPSMKGVVCAGGQGTRLRELTRVDEQAPASGRQLADDLLPAPAARARAAWRASSSSRARSTRARRSTFWATVASPSGAATSRCFRSTSPTRCRRSPAASRRSSAWRGTSLRVRSSSSSSATTSSSARRPTRSAPGPRAATAR